MPFIGNQPALSYTSFAKQDFTTSATTSYTLDNPVANANELALFINNVRQEPTTAYSASSTTLTLTEATSSFDDMYCVYLGKAVQTVNPPNASVGTSQLADNGVTTAKILDDAVTETKLSALANPFASQLLHVRKESSSNNDGASVVGDQTRTLNTIVTNEITGASLSSNQITLPSGTFYIIAKAPFRDPSRNRAFLYNVTDASVDLLGVSAHNSTSGTSGNTFTQGRFTINASKVFELRHYCSGAASTGLGLGTSDGRTQVYSDVQIWRIA